MNAGLLGEHLASPRTALTTHQSTALDPATASDGAPSDQSDFAAFVAQDTEPSSTDPAIVDESALTQPGINATIDAPPLKEPGSEFGALDDVEPGAGDRGTRSASETITRALSDRQALAASAPLRNGAQGASEDAAPTGEILARDPRVSGQSENRATQRDLRAGTIKLSENVQSTASNSALPTEIAEEGDYLADPLERFRAGVDRSDADPRLTRAGLNELAQNSSDSATTQFRQTVSTEVSGVDGLVGGNTSRDAALIAAEPVINIGAATSTSSANTVATGLTPTAPSIPVAMPNEITNIILNAINNGVDPQEQLVVQLDPPELGRVMIDFKFDAQGLQQIVVTTENPEALKRLRELHFELTQALREHGLSEQNMSFQQQADERAHDAWQASDPAGRDLQFSAVEDRRTSPSATPTSPRIQARDRLDLLL
ncbi:MAG: flagellar hook-length control protein FliK [Pseudomonadota bacterium]